jgi:hypothetical protein
MAWCEFLNLFTGVLTLSMAVGFMAVIVLSQVANVSNR